MAKKKAPRTKARKTGRPPKYHARYCGMLIRFFDIEPFEQVRIPHYDESGRKHKSGRHKGEGVITHYEIQRNPNRTPTLQRFAKKIKVGISTVYDWLNEEHASHHKEFSDAFACARELRTNFLMENGLLGCHNSSTSQYVMNNLTDFTNTQKHELTGEVSLLPPTIK